MTRFIGAAALLLLGAALPHSAIAQAGDPYTIPANVADAHQARWISGHKLESDGIEDLAKASAEIARHAEDAAKAQDERMKYRSRSSKAEAEFAALTRGPVAFSDPREARDWARKVEKAASEWARDDSRRVNRREDLDSASKKQSKAQTDARKAQAKIARGRAMKAEAVRRSLAGQNR